MKRLLAAGLLLVLSCASAFASSCNVTEFRLYAPSGVQIADLDSKTADQSPVTTSGVSALSAAFSGDTQMIRVWCDTQSAANYDGTTTPTATTSNMPLSAGVAEYFKVTGGKKIAFILRP